MTDINISFAEEKKGYDKNQVDSYIKKLSDAYQTTYSEYMDVRAKYDALLEDSKKSDEQEKASIHPEIIAKALVNVEILAQSITADANAEAEVIKTEAQKIMDDANNKVAKAKTIVQKIINEANAEAVIAKEAAQKIINDANTEAAIIVVKAKKSLEQTYKTMEQAKNEVRKLMDSPVWEAETAAAV